MFYVEQIGNNDCLFASLKMLLANYYHQKHFLYLPNSKNSDEPYSYLDIIEFAKSIGIILSAYKVNDKSEIKNNGIFPIIVTLNIENKHHSCLMYKLNKKYVYLLDPSKGKHKLKIDEFISLWDATLIKIDNPETYEYKNNHQSLIKKKERILLISFQILSGVFCIIGSGFLSKSFPTYIPLIFICLFAIFEIILRKYMLILLSRLDKRIYTPNLNIKKNRFKEFYVLQEENKKETIKLSVNLIYYLLVIIFVAFLFIVNSTINLIYICFGVVFAFITAFIINPYLEKRNKELCVYEKQLDNLNDENAFELVSKIHKKSYEYGSLYLSWQYLVILLTLIGIFIVMKLSNIVNLTYVCFYLVTNYLLFTNLTHLLTYSKLEKKHLITQVKIINLYD